jgi:hypothetical protein
MPKERIQTRLDPPEVERVEKYRDEHGFTQAEATRRLIQEGLDSVERDEPEWREELEEFRERFEADGREDTIEHTMHQMNATTIGSVALSIATAALAIKYLPALGLGALALLFAVGLGLIAYGIAPAVRAARDTDDTQEVSADA